MPIPTLSAPEPVRLLGHDIRWQLARQLSRSDRKVGELVEAVGERQNLVSYHLGLLRRAGLVSERRSSRDSRDIYYSLNVGGLREGLDQSLATLHPALRVTPFEGTPAVVQSAGQPRLLFVCTGNSARSQLAEAIARDLAGTSVSVTSAGPRPTGIHPMTLTVLKELGFSADGLRSKGIDEIEGEFDFVITLCDVAREDCPPFAGGPELIHWSLPDPARLGSSRRNLLPAFRRTAEELRLRITYLLPVVLAPTSHRSRAASK
ncbi:MAG TPA: ArsR family transcriptional regulator [Candidatus Dormibacteraeota bacterium]|nr:ArsR family transcriptional regulator [Candidatus Dormibacteraeota bacterium]